MGEVVSFAEHKMQKFVGIINGFVDAIRTDTQAMYDMIAPLGFKTRRRIPIAKMNIEQLDRFNDEMNAWAYKNYPELMVQE
jgi:hypothetical protein